MQAPHGLLLSRCFGLIPVISSTASVAYSFEPSGDCPKARVKRLTDTSAKSDLREKAAVPRINGIVAFSQDRWRRHVAWLDFSRGFVTVK